MTAELVAQFEKRFSQSVVIQGNLRQPSDRFFVTALLGPSGCGKTTILRCLAGLERPESGTITFGGDPWFDAQRRLFRSPQERDIGYLFQEYALFPHLTVAENVDFGIRQLPAAERRRRVVEMLTRFELVGLEARYPHQISGGQQQRVALARVVARRPRLLLLDEPLSALDAVLREEVRRALRQLLGQFDIPVVLVTHERMEAVALADRVVVLDRGAICQSGTVQEVFTQPADLTVARIVGVENIQRAHVVEVRDGLATVVVGNAKLTALASRDAMREAFVCIRAEDVMLQRGSSGPSSPRNQLEGQVTAMVAEQPMVRVSLNCGFMLTALVTRLAAEEMQLRVGESVTAAIKVSAVHLIPRD